jgi:hypothetical protein
LLDEGRGRAQIRNEVETYSQLIPDQNELSGTLFVEIDDKERLYEWLPKLVGIQRAVSIWLHDGSSVPGTPEDEERLTREETTTTVHYLKFRFAPEQIEALAAGPVRIVVDHPNYDAVVELTEAQRSELVEDLRVA